MRIVRYMKESKISVGIVNSWNESELVVVDITDRLPVECRAYPEAFLNEIRLVAGSHQLGNETIRLRFEDLLSPLGQPKKLLCAAMNYHEHIAEIGVAEFRKSGIVPKLFLKPSSSLLAPVGELVLPAVSDAVDWELELAVIMLGGGRNIPVESALNFVGGYTVFNDISARSMHWGMRERADSHWSEFFDWLMGKWPDGFAPCGPWIVTADEISDPQNLRLELALNGVIRQDSSTRAMIFSVSELVSFASSFMSLEPGDVIATGTPSGVGAATNTYLRSGDIVTGTIEGIGTIRTKVSDSL